MQLVNIEGDMHIIYIEIGASDMPHDPNLVSSSLFVHMCILSVCTVVPGGVSNKKKRQSTNRDG